MPKVFWRQWNGQKMHYPINRMIHKRQATMYHD